MQDEIIQKIPSDLGSYLLWLHLPQTHTLMVGRLGQFTFPRGDYAYLGSAYGPGGLRARLRRHLRGDSKPHWHIDNLRTLTQVLGYGYVIHSRNTIYPVPTECDWSQMLASLPEAGLPAPGFGASDCRSGCDAHLVYFPSLDADRIANLLNCETRILNIE